MGLQKVKAGNTMWPRNLLKDILRSFPVTVNVNVTPAPVQVVQERFGVLRAELNTNLRTGGQWLKADRHLEPGVYTLVIKGERFK